MNFIEFETPQKLRGGYYTHPDVAAFLTRWAMEGRPKRLLEPACGDGVFFGALTQLGCHGLEQIVGCEIDPAEADKARERAVLLGQKVAAEIVAGDFLEWYLSWPMDAPRFEAVVGNPPFIRYQYLDAILQARAERIFLRHGLAFTKHTNAWVPFVIASLAMLRPGGRLAMVVPSELLHVLHARPLRDFLLAQCSRVLVLDPADIWFGDTLQGVVLLMAQKREAGDAEDTQVAILPIKDRNALARPPREHFRRADFFPGAVLNGKWMLGLLTHDERQLFERLGQHPAIRPFKDVADVDVGLVTGANKFFLVPDAVVREYGLERWAHPMFGRSDHVRGVIYDRKSHEENRRAGLPSNFLWFGDKPDELSASARRYIRMGESQKLHQRYKCRMRTPWYNVPSVYLTPLGMLKRSHNFPRLILNKARAYTTDTAYRIISRAMKAADLTAAFVNSLTALSAELEGRHYGGGVLELVPSEIEKLLLPVAPNSAGVLLALDRSVRSGMPAEELLAQQDSLLLRPMGIPQTDLDSLLAAWARLHDRRHRTSEEVIGEAESSIAATPSSGAASLSG